MKLLLLTANPEVARYVHAAGVDRVFVDMEWLGKAERQAGRDVVMNRHTLEDVAAVRAAVPDAELLVRINPVHPGTAAEVEGAVGAGADLVMLPMFHTPEEVAEVAARVDGRAGLVPLVETPGSLARLHEIARVPGVTELYLGLNDLHLGLGLDFMFEPLAAGMVDGFAAASREAGVPFGFGGIARLGAGALPAELVLSEHARLGSSSVILARSFYDKAETVADFEARLDLAGEIRRLREAFQAARAAPAEARHASRRRLQDAVASLARSRRAPAPAREGASP